MFGVLQTPDGPVGYHLSTVKPPRQVPASERHSWTGKTKWPGDSATCKKCACVKRVGRDYETTYRMPGSALDASMRPPCTGTPATSS